MYFFVCRILSYFAKPNFIIYDEWFDDDFKKSENDFKNKKIKTISNIHEYFYDQSNHNFGASENNLQFNIKLNEKEIITNNYFNKTSEKYNSVTNKKFKLFKKLTKSKLKFYISRQVIYYLSIFSFIFIFGFFMFFISQSKNSESNIINKSLSLEKDS
jgi:hypothetical protein